MANKCICGAEKRNQKKVQEVTVHLSNPGTVKFEAPAVKCENCGRFTFSEKDAETVFESFDAARQKN